MSDEKPPERTALDEVMADYGNTNRRAVAELLNVLGLRPEAAWARLEPNRGLKGLVVAADNGLVEIDIDRALGGFKTSTVTLWRDVEIADLTASVGNSGKRVALQLRQPNLTITVEPPGRLRNEPSADDVAAIHLIATIVAHAARRG